MDLLSKEYEVRGKKPGNYIETFHSSIEVVKKAEKNYKFFVFQTTNSNESFSNDLNALENFLSDKKDTLRIFKAEVFNPSLYNKEFFENKNTDQWIISFNQEKKNLGKDLFQKISRDMSQIEDDLEKAKFFSEVVFQIFFFLIFYFLILFFFFF